MERKKVLVASGVALATLGVFFVGADAVTDGGLIDSDGAPLAESQDPGAVTGKDGKPSKPTKPEIRGEATPVNTGGGLSPYLPVNCFVAVPFTDDTLSSGENYRAIVFDANGDEVTRQEGADVSVPQASVSCDAFQEGEAYTIAVEEKSPAGAWEENTARTDFTLSYVKAPQGIEDSSVERDGIFTHFVGQQATINFTGGEWEEGTKFSTRIWTSETEEFTAEDDAANLSGTAAIVDVTDQNQPVLRWTPRPEDSGRYVWISIVGSKAGKADRQFFFNVHRVAPLPQIPDAWIDTVGAVDGEPIVGGSLEAPTPEFTATGLDQQLSLSYQWYYSGATAIDGATGASFSPTEDLVGQELTVDVVIEKPGFEPRKEIVPAGIVQDAS